MSTEQLRAVLTDVTNAFMWALSESNDVIEDGTGHWSCVHCDGGGSGASFEHKPGCMYIKGMKALHAARAALAATAPSQPTKVPGMASTNSIIGVQYCDDCDGCGWTEGGKYLQTLCLTCKGNGTVPVRERGNPRRKERAGK